MELPSTSGKRWPNHLTDKDKTDLVYGYALLFALASDEAKVDQVFLIKKGRPEFREAIKKIGVAARALETDLERLRQRNGAQPFGSSGLPKSEAKTRQAIAGDKQKRILMGNPTEFEKELLLSQYEGLSYGTFLMKTLAQQETNDSRRQLLEKHSQEWESLRQMIFQRIRIPSE